ncbi:MAG TPA: sulfonate ABC transporter permease [Firmicutes bacterium]|nr:sulfonate ABC transporter permease [Bacillota bacterium]
MRKYKFKVLFTQIIAVTLLIGLWEFGAKKGWINEFIFSSPSKVLETGMSLIRNGELFSHISTTLGEIGIAFAIGIGIGFTVSVILYSSKFLADVVEPFLTILNSLPKVALGPIIIIWVGANTNSIILMAILINVFISIITIYNGFIHTDELRVKLFKTFKASKWQILTKLVIPSSLATIVSALKINISLTLIGVIMGEFLVSKKGLGYLILYGTQVFNLNLVITGVFVLVIISVLLYKLVEMLDKMFKKVN